MRYIPVIISMLIVLPVGASEKRSSVPLHEFQKHNPCPSTGKTTGACPGHVKDHKWPLCAGGPDVEWNIQWQTVEEAKVKDVLEKQVCAQLRKEKKVEYDGRYDPESGKG
jgi:hypothetical protein